MAAVAVVVSLVMILQTARADSTIQNAAYAPVVINGGRVYVGQVVTVGIESGKSTGAVDLAFARNATDVAIRNRREYFVVVNQSGGTGIIRGRTVRTLDLVEGRRVETSF